MTTRKYSTAQGKTVDLGALALRNESVRAVGNMSVNARGDIIDAMDNPIEPRAAQARRNYDRQVSTRPTQKRN